MTGREGGSVEDGVGRTKRRLFDILEVNAPSDPVSVWVSRIIVVLIVANLAAAVLETLPEYRGEVRFFTIVEVVTVAIFAIEFGIRLWVADLHPPLRRFGSVGARLHYLRRPGAVIDALAILPSLVGFLFGLGNLDVLVVFRLLRFLKLARYSPGMQSLLNAVASERRALIASAILMAGILLTAASLMHMLEGSVQPDRFGSIPQAMYWAVTTLTTVGYGDVVPVTPAGKVLAGITMVIGFCMFALPVGIIATAFAREIHQRDFVVSWGMVARVPLFAELSAAEIAEVTRLLFTQVVEAGTVITRAGDPAHTMYFIQSGTVEIDLPRGRVRLGENSFFGEIAVLRKASRSADVVALTMCRLLLLDARDLHQLMGKNEAIARHIRAVARERVGHDVVTPHGDIAVAELKGAERDPDD